MPPETQSDRSSRRSRHRAAFLARPLALALVVTLANAAKPVLIDDTAYLAYARHIAANPLDPYSFEIFWYAFPEPAFDVLCPPVVPYWLALGIALFGEHPALLKLWLFPFVWAFAWAVGDLLRRFARGTESRLLPLLVLSPAVLPTLNLMLDVPALGLGLAAVAVFARAANRGSWKFAACAGLLAGLAMQTKYTALLIPPTLGWYGLTHRRVRLATLAVGVAVALFVGWELALVQQYGRSHFVFHARSLQPDVKPGETTELARLREKLELGPALVGHFGCLGVGVALVVGTALGVPRRGLTAVAVVWAVGFLLVLTLPYRWTVIVPGRPPDTGDDTATATFWQSSGTLFLAAIWACAAALWVRSLKRLRFRSSAGTAFLVGWLGIEFVGYFALTPFGAARRVIGLTVVGGLLAARALSRAERVRPSRRLPRWVVAFGVAAGFTVAALDTFDAFAEKDCAERAAVVADRPPGATVWYAGHWGFQYYCERAGMRPLVPGESVLSPGDVVVLPEHPDARRFYRPHIASGGLRPPFWVADPVAEVVWDDVLSGQTIPNFHGGADPVVGRDHPRLRVVVYRVRERWAVGR